MSVLSNNTLAGSSGQGGGAADYAIDRSLRFNSGDSAHLSKTFASAGNRKTFTLSAWVKLSNVAATQHYLFASNNTYICFTNAGTIEVNLRSGSTNYFSTSNAVFRDFSSFFHLVWRVDTANSSMKIYINGEEITFSSSSVPNNADTDINRNAQHNIGKSDIDPRYFDGYLADIHFIDGQALAASDFGEYDDNNVWQPKEFTGTYGVAAGSGINYSSETVASNGWSSNNPLANMWDGDTSTQAESVASNQTTHVTWTPATAITNVTSLRVYGLLNNNQYDAREVSVNGGSYYNPNVYGTTQWWDLIANTQFNSGDTLTEIKWQTRHFSGGNAGCTIRAIEVNGQVLTNPSPAYQNGFHLDFSDTSSNAALGTDTSGNGNTWTVNNLSVAAGAGNDALVDTPEQRSGQTDTGVGGEVVGNYATWNPLDKSSSLILSNGNLDAAETTGAGHFAGRATFKYPATGKWYYEATITTLGGACCIGVDNSGRANPSLANSGVSLILVNSSNNVQRYIGSSYTSFDSAYGNPAVGSVLQVAYDADADKLWLGMGNVWMGSGSSANGNPGAGSEATASNVSDPFPVTNLVTSALSANFGQRAFAYTAPSGYKALCTANLPDPTIEDGSTYFKTILRSGGGTTQTPGFSPDLVWEKRRDSSSSHYIFDRVRGDDHYLSSNQTTAEGSGYSNWLTFDSNGYTVGASNDWPGSASVVDWTWDAGSSNTTIAAGVLNSSVYNISGSTLSSNLAASSGFKSGMPATQAFDGNTGTRAGNDLSTGGGTLTYTGTINVGSSIEFLTGIQNTVTINGSITVGTSSVDPGWVSYNSAVTVTSFVVTAPNSNGYRADLFAVKVDGKILVDSGVTPPNVPSIASTVRANPSAGFSIVPYTGTGSNASVGHGLNAAPELVIIKGRDFADSWHVYHKDVFPKYLRLNTADSEVTNTAVYPSIPSSSVVNIGSDAGLNTNTKNFITYCFAPVEGYSSAFSYTGNGSTDGPFVFLGFRPSWILLKRSDAAGDWRIWDTSRGLYNVSDFKLYPNNSNAETGSSDTNEIDILSNGFKLRSSVSEGNASGGTYVGYAFAEHPFKTSRAR